jgi:predicted 3-demethylubiquinone-9 3-methyltransferase (glyoxalase superfamily)
MREIAPCLWFDTEDEAAATFYTPSSRIANVTHYDPAGPREEGMVMTVEFELNGQKHTALNGRRVGRRARAGGSRIGSECHGRSTRFGFTSCLPISPGAERAMRATLRMKKIDIAALERAAAGA